MKEAWSFTPVSLSGVGVVSVHIGRTEGGVVFVHIRPSQGGRTNDYPDRVCVCVLGKVCQSLKFHFIVFVNVNRNVSNIQTNQNNQLSEPCRTTEVLQLQ